MSAVVNKYGSLDMQVCVPGNWSDQQVIEFAEQKNPSGTENGWHIRRAGDASLKGQPERVALCCEQHLRPHHAGRLAMFPTTLSLFLFCSSVASMECVTMKFLDINALDDLDPVHDRRANLAGDNDYDGDMGREHSEYLRDNGIGGRQSSVAGTFVQIADALPVIEAPSIVAEHPAIEPVKTESKG